MNIVFVNSCLESGRDGVGDYMRRLSAECVRQGHRCRLLSLNDKYVSVVTTEEIPAGPDTIKVLRIPSTTTWPERVRIGRSFLAEFRPDWISLQFVCYGFHPKGMPTGLAEHLVQMFGASRTHLMLHELWIGEDKYPKLSHRVIGQLQRRIILQLVRRLNPSVVHTSNSKYIQMLKKNKVTATVLPLFGNLPVCHDNADKWIVSELNKAYPAKSQGDRGSYLFFGFFGLIHPVWPAEPLLTILERVGRRKGKQSVILSIGRDEGGEMIWQGIVDAHQDDLMFCRFGEQPAEKISRYLNSLDFGIATSPATLIGKSGTVAAMIDHGVPTVVNRMDIPQPSSAGGRVFDNDLLLSAEDNLEERLISYTAVRQSAPQLPVTAAKLLGDLERQPV